MTTTHESVHLDLAKPKQRPEVVTWITGFFVAFAWTYFFGLHLGWNSADFLRGLLQGDDMAHGNVLLNHWYSGSDSYWLIDSILFMLGVLVVGVKVALARIVAASVWTGVIVLSCIVARIDSRRCPTAAATAVIVLTLGLPSALLARFLSASADHMTTVLVCLLAFLGLRNGRFGWGWLVASVLLAAGLLSDPLIVAYALVPCFVVGVLDSVRSREWAAGFATSSAPIAATALALTTRKVAEHFGTYQIRNGTPLVPPAARLENLHTLIPDALTLLGFGSSFSDNRIPWELGVFRIFGVVILAAGLVLGFGCLSLGVVGGEARIAIKGVATRSRASYRLSDLLVLGVFGDAVTYVVFRDDATGLRYLTAGIVFSSILGAMLCGQFVTLVKTPTARNVCTAVLVVVLGVNVACAALFLSRRAPISPFPRLSTFLVSHDLDRGVGDYWTSAPVTLYSEEKVKVRQVLPTGQGGLRPYLWIAKSTWYNGKFQFLVYDVHQYQGQLIRSASGFPFARVSHIYREGPFRIVVWRQPQPMENLVGR